MRPMLFLAYLRMIFLLFLHDFNQTWFGYVIILSEIVLQVFFSPVRKWATVMLVLSGCWTSDDISAVLGSFRLFLTHQAVCVFDVIHVALQI